MRLSSISLAVLLSGAGLSQPLLAQVTPEDVWGLQRDFYTAAGLQVSAVESRSGDTLTLSEVTGTVELPQGLGRISMVIGPIDLTAQADGSVVVAYHQPSEVRFTAMFGPMGDMSADITLSGAQENTSIVATGTPDAITYTAEAGRTTITLSDLALRGDPELEQMDATGLTVALDIRDSVGVTTLSREDDRLTMEVQSLTGPSTYVFQGDFREDIGFLMDTSGTSASSIYTGRTVLPAAGVNYINLAESIRAGLALDITSRIDGMSSVSITEDNISGETRQTGETEFSESRLSLGESGLLIEGSTGPSRVDYAMPGLIPFQIQIALAGSGLVLQAPLLAGDTPQDARLAISLDDLVLDDRLVRLLDPSELLPRDPISFELDLGGQMTVLTDLVDFLGTGAMIGQGITPVEPTSVTLTSVALSGAGVEMTSSGSFSLDMTDGTFMDGMPFRPVGSAQARATGINGLIDTLVTMGLIPEPDAGMARLGLGMFARNVGDDTLESLLEVTPEGSVLLNGNRIR